MDLIEKIFITLNPLSGFKQCNYAMFLGIGEVPFTQSDADGVVGIRGKTLGSQWINEKAKFDVIANKYIEMVKAGYKTIICYILPNGNEMVWTPEGITTIKSYRGEALSRLVKASKQTSNFLLGAIVQYTYPKLYPDEPFSEVLPFVETLKVDTRFGAKPVLLDKQIAPSVIRDFWNYYQNKTPRLMAKYGQAPSVTTRLTDYSNVYTHGKFEEFYNYFESLDADTADDRGLMMSVISDDGNQYVIFRYQRKIWHGVLPGTEGTRELISKAPPQIRMLVQTIYTS